MAAGQTNDNLLNRLHAAVAYSKTNSSQYKKHTISNKCFQVARHSMYIRDGGLIIIIQFFVALKDDGYRRRPYDAIQDHLKSHVTPALFKTM